MDSDPDQSFDKEKLELQIKLGDGDRYGRFIEFCRKYYGKSTKTATQNMYCLCEDLVSEGT